MHKMPPIAGGLEPISGVIKLMVGCNHRKQPVNLTAKAE